VADVNTSLQIGSLSRSQTVSVGSTLTFNITATDTDEPSNTVFLSASGLVAGMSFDPVTGTFAFTPDASQDGMVFTVTFTATDNGTPALSDTETVTIGVGVPALAGDVNGDCVVNIVDISLAGAAFGSTSSSPSWNAAADLNNDGVINILDLAIVATNFGRTCP